jgi:hypothetical protein
MFGLLVASAVIQSVSVVITTRAVYPDFFPAIGQRSSYLFTLMVLGFVALAAQSAAH